MYVRALQTYLAKGRRVEDTELNGRIKVGQDLIDSGTRDRFGAGRTVAPRNAT